MAETATAERDPTPRPEPGGPQDPSEGALLRSRRFLPLFLVQGLGAFNDNLFKNAFVALLTFRLSAELEMSLVTLTTLAAGVFILPFALFAPLAGQIADGMDKARMMRAVKAVEIGLMVLAAVAYHRQDVLSLYVLLFLMGAQSAFFSPIKYGVLPVYLRRSELVRGNGMIQAATFLAILIGTIAGLNLILTEAGVTIVSVGVILLAIVGYVASRAAPPAPPQTGAYAVLENYGLRQIGAGGRAALSFASMRAAIPAFIASAAVLIGVVIAGPGGLGGLAIIGALWALIWAVHVLWPSMADSVAAAQADSRAWRAVLGIGWFWYVGATFMALLPAYAKERLGGDETVVNVLLAAFSIGVAIGALLCGRLMGSQIKVGPAPLGALGIMVFSIDLAFATPVQPMISGDALMRAGEFLSDPVGWRILVDFMGLAICAGLYVTPLNAIYQNAAPADARGRVVACSNMIDSALMVLSAVAILGLEAAGLAPQHIFAVVGGTGIVTAFLVARWSPESRIGQAALKVWPARATASAGPERQEISR